MALERITEKEIYNARYLSSEEIKACVNEAASIAKGNEEVYQIKLRELTGNLSAKKVADTLLKSCEAQIPAIKRAAMERVKRIVLESIAAEPEYPHDMPDELWVELDGNRENVTKAMRSTVRLTKNGITDRFLEALKSELLGKGDKINKEGEDGG